MVTALTRNTTAFLCRVGMVAGMLAIIAGIFGMHILSGSHDMPMAAGGSQAGTLHGAHVMSGPVDGQKVGEESSSPVPGASSCLDPAPCPIMAAMDQECVPAPCNTSFDAPVPGSVTLAYRTETAPDQTAGQLYRSSSPSPGDLGISRT
ncbi:MULTISPECIES: hypothetical protein [unclassified Paenarthrobacter]|uniref:hypothetical protein n=1 Tax=unclassified Paenarthrobacter TaxID=2634190 RepID=UPI00084E7B86|nr:hypothetical protein [Paenarthrobacter sp. R1]NKR10603.1 hypothetical protein [Arthrobacter sp. M5]NKR16443.1 hypothetical protein [Arthrobacter sp. M6]OEH61445.1 hypothetical protein A5N13_17040 [Arthrobacter sp. D4]OEH64431.1 hypothetical protein A5N17_06435 [Arthrobacter sp. D2]WIV29215.1 hypothetical protein QN084_12595 [Paenarthrobacter sp. R1]